jgi:methionine-rich copper-binding protein CopC
MAFRNSPTLTLAASALAALLLSAAPAFAHAHLVSSQPAAEDAAGAAAVQAPVNELRLDFSEAPTLAFSKVTITGTDGQEVAHGDLAVDPAGDKTLVVPLSAPLAGGEYTIEWTTVASDGHKSSGTYKINIPQ